MMGSRADLAALKDIPGYKAILKTVLKSQIQLLLEQLSQNTGEESVILTASIDDGSLSHLGSSMGRGFLDGREEIKSQFLGFCLKGHHQLKPDDGRNALLGRLDALHTPTLGSRRPRIRPHPYAMASTTSNTQSNSRTSIADFSTSPSFHKTEDSSSNSADNFLDSVSGNGQVDQTGFSLTGAQPQSQISSHSGSGDANHSTQEGNQPDRLIKTEPGSEDPNEDGSIVEQADNSASTDQWGQGDPNEADQSGFNADGSSKQDDKGGENLGGIAFPGLDNAHHDFKGFPDISPTELKHALYPDAGRNQENSMFDVSLHTIPYSAYTSPVRSRMSSPRKATQYWCNYCNKSLQNKALYEYHVRAHNGVKPFECKLCFRKFAGKQVLETHMRLHSGEKPFKCNVPGCGRAFSARSGYDYHIKKHHPPDALLNISAGELGNSNRPTISPGLSGKVQEFS